MKNTELKYSMEFEEKENPQVNEIVEINNSGGLFIKLILCMAMMIAISSVGAITLKGIIKKGQSSHTVTQYDVYGYDENGFDRNGFDRDNCNKDVYCLIKKQDINNEK